MSNHLITNKTYLPALEGWRGIVSVFVLLFHFYIFFANDPFMPYAFLGVDFFFILSGFIIARQYEAAIATRSIGFKDFAIRRFSRLWPLFIVSILSFVAVNHFYIQPNLSPEQPSMLAVGMGPMFAWHVLLQLTMLTNIGGMVMPWNGPAWSVSVEWIVNLAFFLAAWKLRRIPTLFWVLIAAFCAIYLIDYSPKTLNVAFADQPFFNPSLARGFLGFAIGALIFRFHHSLPPLGALTLHGMDVLLVLAIFTLLGYYNGDFVISIDYVFLFAIFPPIIIISLYRKSWIGRIAGTLPFTFLGKISYSIYLMHLPLGYFYQYSTFVQELNLTRPMYGLGFMAFTIGVSTLTYLFIEAPCRIIGRRMTRQEKPTLN